MVKVRAFRTLENSFRRMGFNHVAGVDEVGRGCLAGPVVAAAVVLNPDRYVPRVCDSKTVTALERERLYVSITRAAVAWGVAAAAVQEMTPGPLRGQASALFLFLVNVIGLALGPTSVALLTDGVFRDQALVGLSLLAVTLLGRAVSAALFAWGLRPYRETVAGSISWVPGGGESQPLNSG